MAKAIRVLKPNKQRKRQLFSKEERSEWINLNVNVDSYCDHWESIRPDFIQTIQTFGTFIERICKSFSLTKSNPDQSWTELLFSHPKAAIETYCVWKFASVDPLCYSRLFKIRAKKKNHTNMPALVAALVEEQVSKSLVTAFIQMQIKKSGHARYNYSFTDKTKEIDHKYAIRMMHLLCSYLKKKEGMKYALRFSDSIGKAYYFLLLKETSDKVYPAIPENLRVISGRYLLISIHTDTHAMAVHSPLFREARYVSSYIGKKTGIKMQPTHKEAQYDPATFFDLILASEQTSGFTLIDAVFDKTNIGDKIIDVHDRYRKNNIVAVLNKLKADRYVELKSFTEFKNFVFDYEGIRYHVNVHEDRWGQIRLEVADRGKPAAELAAFLRDFEAAFGIPLQTSLRNQNLAMNKAEIIQKILDKPTLEAVLPTEVDKLLLELIAAKIIAQPTTSVKRRCTNPTCYKVYWKQGSCPECGSNFYYEGDYIDLDVRTEPVLELISRQLESDGSLKLKKVTHQIESAKFSFLEILTTDGKSLAIYGSKSTVPDKIITQYVRTGNPLLVIIMKYAPALRQRVEYMDFECLDFATCYAQASTGELTATITHCIQQQHNKWKEKITRKGYTSFNDYKSRNEAVYHDQDFEYDIYNMLHEIFLVGDRLGGKFAGIAAPDGIVSIQDYGTPLHRYCLAWDCKYSKIKKGYQLGDPPIKHRAYIHKLKLNDKVLFYGGLKTYCIISQNMDFKTYQNFYTKMIQKFRWPGQVVFIHADLIQRIYEVYRENQALISSYPTIFYSKLFNLFRKTDKADSTPFRALTARKVDAVMEQIKLDFKPVKKSFIFKRNEF